MSNEGADIRDRKERSRPCGKIPQILNFLLSMEISINLHVSNNASNIKYYDKNQALYYTYNHRNYVHTNKYLLL